MVEKETGIHSKKEKIKVKLGEPFVITPNFQHRKEYPDQIVLQESGLEIEELGQGRIKILKDKTLAEMTEKICVRTPAGPVELKYVMDNSQPVLESLEPTSLPLTIHMYIDGLTQKQLLNTKVELYFDGKKFEGETEFDELELNQNGQAQLYVMEWIDPDTGESCELYFPENTEIFSRMKFVIRTKT
jgi:hypothetical protein